MQGLRGLECRTRATAPDGRVWTVRRRVTRRSPRWVGWGFSVNPFRADAHVTTGWGNYWVMIALVIGFVMFGLVASIVIVVVLAVVALVVWSFVAPLVVWVLDAIVLTIVALVGLGGHVIARTPWTVEATDDLHPESGFARTAHRWPVTGGAASARAVAELAARIEAGEPLRRPAAAGLPIV